MLSRCRGEMLSEVMLPPYPPHPSVIAGSSPVVRPIEPSVVGVLTTIRNAGFFSPNSESSRISQVIVNVSTLGQCKTKVEGISTPPGMLVFAPGDLECLGGIAKNP